MARPDRPNLFVVVLDCARAWDLPGGPDPVGQTPVIERLRSESIEFPRASGVAHWTIPAHASIFTGLYPWQHGVHAKGRLALPPGVPQIAPTLREGGYATMSLSANGLISPALGFTEGCDRAAWGVSLFNRISASTTPPQGLSRGARGATRAENLLSARLKPLSYWAAVYMARYPGFWDLGTRVVHRVRVGEGGLSPRMAPWVEPTLGRWLSEVPAEKPVYGFINLLDAHEPYLSHPTGNGTGEPWRRYAGTRQDRLGWVSGDWSPTAEEFGRLHRLYRGTLRLLDERVGRIIEELRRADRWENTLFVLTSDHGQAFGEHGTLFHITSIDEPELRIPLLVKMPGSSAAGGKAVGWASLIDIAPTLFHAAGLFSVAESLPGTDLRGLIDAPRPSPVFAFNDGLVHAPDAARAPTARKARIDRLIVGAYLEDRKVLVDPATGERRAFEVDRDRMEEHDLWPSEGEDLAPISELASDVGRQILAGPAATLGADVEDRLRSWGYI